VSATVPRSVLGLLRRIVLLPQHVAQPTHGVQQLGVKIAIDLASDVVHVDIDDLERSREVARPDVLVDDLSAQNAPLVAEEKLEKLILTGSQRETMLRTRDDLRGGVENEVTKGEKY